MNAHNLATVDFLERVVNVSRVFNPLQLIEFLIYLLKIFSYGFYFTYNSKLAAKINKRLGIDRGLQRIQL